MAIHAYTSFSYSYLDRARVLARSIRKHHPDWVIWAVLTDKEPQGFTLDWSAEDYDKVITAEDLFGPGTDSWLFGLDIVEACTAVKGKALLHILADPTADKVFYFDPDIALFNPVTPISDLLDSYSVVLTPHQIDPEPATDKRAIMDNEVASLYYGTFNLGFIAVKNDSEAHRFATWWAERLRDWCHDRLDVGIFVDQKWCNLVPCFFDKVKILRDPGCNVASWNLSQRKMRFDAEGQALINDVPLRFYHFTKLGPVGDTMTRRYARDNDEIHELWWWYRQQILASFVNGIQKGWWHYSRFNNGVEIKKSLRELYRNREDLKAAFPHPYETGVGSFYRWHKAGGT